jgi:hypothetical protein
VAIGAHLVVDLPGVDRVDGRLDLADGHARIEDGHVRAQRRRHWRGARDAGARTQQQRDQEQNKTQNRHPHGSSPFEPDRRREAGTYRAHLKDVPRSVPAAVARVG